MNKTTISAKAQDITRKWYVIDAKDQVLGDVAVHAANLLRGKTKPIFTPHVDTGDYVVIINAKDVVLTGNKDDQKTYVSVSGYIGSKKVRTIKEVRAKHPERIIEHAVKGMIPHNTLGRHIYKKLRVYPGATHAHADQQLQPYTLA